jgi:hypothetical protein
MTTTDEGCSCHRRQFAHLLRVAVGWCVLLASILKLASRLGSYQLLTNPESLCHHCWCSFDHIIDSSVLDLLWHSTTCLSSLAFDSKSADEAAQQRRQRQQQRRRRRLQESESTKNSSTSQTQPEHIKQHRRCHSKDDDDDNDDDNQMSRRRCRVLYIVTTMHEYDTGRRQTQKGYDRYQYGFIPIVTESIRTMDQSGYDVDLYVISSYTITPQRRLILTQSIERGLMFTQSNNSTGTAFDSTTATIAATTSVFFWDNATPMGYMLEHSTTHIMNHTRGLARQHRYVIKDYLRTGRYDVYVNFEDDMLIKGAHMDNFMAITDELYRQRQMALPRLQSSPPPTSKMALEMFYGSMTSLQLARMIPGFIRVEAILPNFEPHVEDQYSMIPRDFMWNSSDLHHPASVNASICCHVSSLVVNDHIPTAPGADQIHYWETSIDILGIRYMPSTSWLGWVLLQAGTIESGQDTVHKIIGDYWSGRDGYYGQRPRQPRTKGRYLNNQGGWMGTVRQIYEWHATQCRHFKSGTTTTTTSTNINGDGSFLPPYNAPNFMFDGLEAESVEFWSGGIHLVSPKHCNLQRLIPLEPQAFSSSLLYHSSNNKQFAPNVRHRYSDRSINHLWGQLNTVRRNAEKVMNLELSERHQ